MSGQLIKLGYKVQVICANEPPSDGDELIKGIEVKRLSYLFKLANTNIMPMFPFAIAGADVDIIHTHMPTPWTADWSVLIAKLRNKTSVLTIHNDMDKSDPLGKLITWLYLKTFFLMTLHLVDTIVIVNPYWRTAFTNTHQILERMSHKIIAVPNGVDTQIFHPANNKNFGTTILFVSILDEHHRFKGLEYLLNALPRVKEGIPDVKLIVIGEGSLVEEYRSIAKELGVYSSVEFKGKKTQKELPDYYQQSDVFVLPSIEIEGFGIVLLEAMASGIPVVTTDIVGIAPEIKQQNAGIVVSPRDSEALGNAIISILENPEIGKMMGKNGHQLVLEKYNWKSIADVLSLAFERNFHRK